MWSWWILIGLWTVDCAVTSRQNVALNKPVRGQAKSHAAMVDGKLHTSIKPNDGPNPMVYVDLQGVYRLTEINLIAQNEASLGNKGLNVPFSLYAWRNYTSMCDMEGLYPWKPVKTNLVFKSKGEKITIQGPVEAHYLILLPDFTDPDEQHSGVPIGELEAFGDKIEDTYHFKLPESGTYMPNTWNETRYDILRNQSRLLAQISYFSYVPDPEFKDVTLGYHYDNNNTIAAIRGKARMILMSGPRVLRLLLNDPDYDAMRENVRKWLNPQNSNAKFVNVSRPFQDGDILTITRFDTFDPDAIAERLKVGKNSAVITYLASRKENDNNKVARLLRAMKIKYRYVNMAFGEVNQNATEILSNAFRDVPWDFQLKMALNSWQQLNEGVRKYYIPRELLSTPYYQGLIRQVIDKYYNLFTYLAPCPQHPYKLDNATRYAQINYARIMMLQRGEHVVPAPGIFGTLGNVKRNAKKANLTLEIKKGFRDEFLPTGVYLKPGEPMRYKILERSESFPWSYVARVNPQIDLITNRTLLHRWPYVTHKFQLEEEGVFASAFGGPLVFYVPTNVTLKIKIEGGYRYAFFDINDPQAKAKWDEQRRLYKGCPYGMIHGDAMTSMLQEHIIRRMSPETIFWSTNHFDNMVKFIHNYRGTELERCGRETYVTDYEILIGDGHAGRPWMSYNGFGEVYDNIEFNKKAKNILYPHELGHNLQVWRYTFINGKEVTNNVYIPAHGYYVLGLKDIYDEGRYRGSRPNEVQAMVTEWKNDSFNGVQLNFYMYLTRLLGPGLIPNVWPHAVDKEGGWPIQEWLKVTCNESGYDLIPFHKLWKFPVHADTLKFCGQFPCFMPDDHLTKQVPEVVNKILKEHGKTCVREIKNKVQVNRDLLKGFDMRKEQTIFIYDN